MIEIELKPTLSSCIQTVAKREYEYTLRELFKEEGKSNGGQGRVLEEKLEILRLFLETADFGELRSQYENSLRSGKSVTFKLRLVNGCMEYERL